MASGSASREHKWTHPDGSQRLGYIHPVSGKYVIFKRVDGKLWERSTGQVDPIRAAVEYERFLAEKADYRPPDPERVATVSEALGIHAEPWKPTPDGAEPIYLTPELIEQHLAWCVRMKKITSEKWRLHKQTHLKWWLKRLHGVNLRKLPKRMLAHAPPSPEGCDLGLHIVAVLDEDPLKGKKPVPGGTRTKLIATIKSLYTWMIEAKATMEPEENPTARLKNEKTGKAQRFGAEIRLNSVEDTLAAIEYWRKRPSATNQHHKTIDPLEWKADVLVLHLETPWHHEEIQRFMDPVEKDSRIILPSDPMWRREWNEPGEDVAAVIAARGKAEPVVRQKVGKVALASALRLRAHGKMGDHDHFRRELNALCKEMGIKRLYPGAYRHTFLTHVEDEHDREAAYEQSFHGSKKMTGIYTTWAVPRKVKTPLTSATR